jgi:putative pyruvate formate lyase activating enzyme
MTNISPCNLCPRMCNALRDQNISGVCKETSEIRAARAMLHYWEEPCISGLSGTGAVFFTGCPLRCVYCQNAAISRGDDGKVISEERLSDIFLELQDKGANNIDLITAGHFLPGVIRALESAKNRGLSIPVIYNSSGYERVESLRELDGLVDIYLPDMKYMSGELARRYSGAPDYPSAAGEAISEMVRQTGAPLFYIKGDKESGLFGTDRYNDMSLDESLKNREILMSRGTIVRHLILPGCSQDSKDIIRYLYSEFKDDIYISIMNQFTPIHEKLLDFPELDRKVTEEEYESVIDFALDTGVENAFIQEGDTADESFIPDFTYEGL